MTPLAKKGRIAIVRTVGGLDGLDLHAGMWQAMSERGIVGDDLFGASAGAIVSACDASGWSSKRFMDFVSATSTDDLKDARLAWKLRLRGPLSVPAIWRGEKIKALLSREFPGDWSDAVGSWRTIPRMFATRMDGADAIDLSCDFRIAPTPADAIYASCAIPAVFPSYVGRDCHVYRDGGIRRAVPLPPYISDYDHVYICVATGRRRKYAAANDLVSQALTLLQQMFDGQILNALERVSDAPNVTVLWPQPESDGGMLEFDHSLISKAYHYASAILDGAVDAYN